MKMIRPGMEECKLRSMIIKAELRQHLVFDLKNGISGVSVTSVAVLAFHVLKEGLIPTRKIMLKSVSDCFDACACQGICCSDPTSEAFLAV